MEPQILKHMCLRVIHFPHAIAYPLGRRLWQANENKRRHCQCKMSPEQFVSRRSSGQQGSLHVDSFSLLNNQSSNKLAQRCRLAAGLGAPQYLAQGHTSHHMGVYWRNYQGMVDSGAAIIFLSCPAFPALRCSLAK